MVESDLEIARLAAELEAEGDRALSLEMLTSRGTKVWPGEPVGDSVRWYTARYLAPEDREPTDADILSLLGRISEHHRGTQVERLRSFDLARTASPKAAASDARREASLVGNGADARISAARRAGCAGGHRGRQSF
jgi:hypothetical protein